MISYLRLSNFRRHSDTELFFSDTDQVVLVSGANGVGKSTLFEALYYALYGEGRNGRGNIERLIKKGAELEGMEVELHFSIAGVSYEVKRRRDSKLTTAVLTANENPIVEGAREVTEEVSKILGMDAKGFKMATYAQQRELDGLASMRPSERGQMLSRLLRLDVVSRAKEAARAEFRQKRDILKALGTGADLVELNKELEKIEKELTGLEEALSEARKEMTTLDAEIAAAGALEVAYQTALTHKARITALVSAGETELQRAVRDLEAIDIPDEIQAPNKSSDELLLESSEIERKIAEGEAAQRQGEQLRVVKGELSRCESRLNEIDDYLLDNNKLDVDKLQSDLLNKRETLGALANKRQELRDAYSAAKERLERAKHNLTTAESLDAECQTCGQTIDEDHRQEHLNDAKESVVAAESELDDLLKKGSSAKHDHEEADKLCTEAESLVRDGLKIQETTERLKKERVEVLRRQEVYLDQLERLKSGEVDLSPLYTRRAEILVETSMVSLARERNLLRGARLEQKKQAAKAVNEATLRLEGNKTALKEATISADLEAAHERLQSHVEARNAEAEVANTLQTSIARAQERQKSVEKEIQRANLDSQKRSSIDEEAQVSLYASQALEHVESSWAQQLRPSLEGTVSELVSRLSDGRFDGVMFDQDYNVFVQDRGVQRPITELSGGEIDLVALAVRLGLASVVSERHGSGGAGFLILDECFGSQDPSRRMSILNALRGLKQTHGQIFLISHVGGLEDAADAVIEVEIDDDANAVAVRT